MNQDNLVKIEECFRQARITGEISDSSILKYRDSIKKFLSIVGDKTFESLTIVDFEDFILKMRDNEASNSRIANVISALKWVIKRLQDEGRIQRTLDLERVKKPKIQRKEVEYLNEQEIKKLLDCISDDIAKKESKTNIRILALIFLLLESGARIGEVLSIKVKEINWDNNEIPIIGKGRRPRTLFFRDRSKSWLKKYLSIRDSNNEFLFVSRSGFSVWSQTDIGRSYRRFRDLSGISEKYHLHTLRHTTATQLANKGVPFHVIQAILGHARLETTVRYYVGASEKRRIKQIMQDKYYDFIPESVLKVDK